MKVFLIQIDTIHDYSPFIVRAKTGKKLQYLDIEPTLKSYEPDKIALCQIGPGKVYLMSHFEFSTAYSP